MTSRLLILVLAFVLFTTQTAQADLATDIESKLKQHMGGIPSVSYAVVADGEIAAAGAVSSSGVGASRRTQYRIGSLTKSFTAASVLLLQDDGELSVQDDVTKHLPEYQALQGLSIHQLLTHTSGLLNYTTLPMNTLPTPAEGILDAVMSRPGWRSRNTRFAYSNTNYLILGLIIERASGQDYGAFLEDRILDPLGMSRTAFVDADPELAIAFAAGGVVSCSEDMGRWLVAMSEGEIDGVDISALFGAYLPTNATLGGAREGYGWRTNSISGGRKHWHDGSIRGFRSAMALYETSSGRIGVVLLANSQNTSNMVEFLDQLSSIAMSENTTASDQEFHDWIKRIQNGSVFEGPMTNEMRMALQTQGALLAHIASQGSPRSIIPMGTAPGPGGNPIRRFRVDFTSGATTHWQIGTFGDGTLFHLRVQ